MTLPESDGRPAARSLAIASRAWTKALLAFKIAFGDRLPDPSEDAARKLLYLAIQNAAPQWTRTEGLRRRASPSATT